MLQLKSISKEYVTGQLRQRALDGVTLSLRDSEFVAVLGPSGSGKTTLLNIIGGLDRYDSGSMIINGISTERYGDRDWDSYRNHTIGFVFQNYNLISHQSILSNVELSLTIAGVGRSERKARAMRALNDVGLGDQAHKRPNQLSGGQMQRVAIARALVNDPDILLADEPTGALDSETGIQVMELLKQVAKNHLVVMVTHNAELADRYATRIVNLKDGRIVGDSDPFEPEDGGVPEHRNMGRAKMSFSTALSLSFNNLLTKKARTLLTAFAGSIGIIGIALILSLSNGVNNYINDLQRSTMVSYPITLEAQAIDLSSLMAMRDIDREGGAGHELDKVYSSNFLFERASEATGSISENNLSAFKRYLDDESSEIHKYLGENGIVYSYDTRYNVYAYDPTGKLVTVENKAARMEGMFSMMNMGGNKLSCLLPGKDGALISSAVTENYDLLYGAWPENYDEVVLVINKYNELSYSALSEMGFLPYDEFDALRNEIYAGRQAVPEKYSFDYAQALQHRFYLLPACEMYKENENGTYSSVEEDPLALRAKLPEAIELKIVGIIRLSENANYSNILTPIAYTQALTHEIIARTDASAVVTAQKAQPDINVLTGLPFTAQNDADKAEQMRRLIKTMSIEQKEELGKQMVESFSALYPVNMDQMMNMGKSGYGAMLDMLALSENEEADRFLLMLYDAVLSSGSYDENMTVFGVMSLDAPSSISLYADTFEDKDAISACIDRYNETVEESDKAKYTDYVGLLMSSVTTIVNVISYVLIAFVAVSLVVSSIMIGVITYISVLERTKEIGILRAVGASKRNVSQVFNAETFIIGLLAGVLGVGVSLLLLIPINAIIHALAENVDVSAALPMGGRIVLIVLSILLTLISGLIPSGKAARRDPVTALRSE